MLAALCGLAVVAAPLGAQAVPPTAGKPFVDITDEANVRHLHHKCVLDEKLNCIMAWMASVGASAAAADYDDDGDIDLYVTNSKIGTPNRLFRNNGDATFTDVAHQAGVASANDEVYLFDLPLAHQQDLDTRVLSDALREDLSANGVSISQEGLISILETGAKWRVVDPGQIYTIAKEADRLTVFENRGTSMDAVWGDYDNDGHVDLYVTKWGWNILYRANGDGTFTDVTDQARVGDRSADSANR